ncbi:MAG: aldo/keto reductase [Pseudomonadota bacterium]
MSNAAVAGYATRAGTEAYARHYGAACAPGHYSDFLNLHLKLSSLGVGSFPGAADDATDENYAQVVERALVSGINVVDTAAHYRYGRSARAVGAGLRRAFAAGVGRDQVFVIAKGGFLAFPEGPPADLEAWFEREIAYKGLGTRADLSGVHLLSPQHIALQVDACRAALGLQTLDAFLVDQPEVHIPVIGKEQLNRKLQKAFAVLEQAVRDGRIRCYGIATFHGLRVATDHVLFQSLASLLALADKAARLVWRDEGARHHFKLVEFPFNQAMTEAFTRFSQATGQGNIASTIQAAHQLGVYTVASHSLMKGHLARTCADGVRQALPDLANDARRALQFNRSTPGLGTSLVGMATPVHLDDLLAVARTAPLGKEEYLRLYRCAD